MDLSIYVDVSTLPLMVTLAGLIVVKLDAVWKLSPSVTDENIILTNIKKFE